jgi:hypothetical protein
MPSTLSAAGGRRRTNAPTGRRVPRRDHDGAAIGPSATASEVSSAVARRGAAAAAEPCRVPVRRARRRPAFRGRTPPPRARPAARRAASRLRDRARLRADAAVEQPQAVARRRAFDVGRPGEREARRAHRRAGRSSERHGRPVGTQPRDAPARGRTRSRAGESSSAVRTADSKSGLSFFGAAGRRPSETQAEVASDGSGSA